ncbi:MAG: hypothetical protein K8L97_32955, partial [Anaerolineae bacterium]|nr:hypothetical protein [Anaerolineae bacterium]
CGNGLRAKDGCQFRVSSFQMIRGRFAKFVNFVRFVNFTARFFAICESVVAAMAAAARLAEDRIAANQLLAFSAQPLAISFCEWSKSIAAIQNWGAAAILAESDTPFTFCTCKRWCLCHLCRSCRKDDKL